MKLMPATQADELRMKSIDFDSIMRRAIGVAPPPTRPKAKPKATKKATRKKVAL